MGSPSTARMTSPGFTPAASAGSPGTTDADLRVHVGQHADVADLETCLRLSA